MPASEDPWKGCRWFHFSGDLVAFGLIEGPGSVHLDFPSVYHPPPPFAPPFSGGTGSLRRDAGLACGEDDGGGGEEWLWKVHPQRLGERCERLRGTRFADGMKVVRAGSEGHRPRGLPRGSASCATVPVRFSGMRVGGLWMVAIGVLTLVDTGRPNNYYRYLLTLTADAGAALSKVFTWGSVLFASCHESVWP